MHIYLPLILFCFSTSFSPGPNNLMLLMSGLNYGIKRSIPHFLGIGLGFALMLLVVGFGLGELFRAFPVIHKVIKVVGSAYMLYLAYKTIFASTKIYAQGGKRPVNFLAAILFQWANPKAWIMSVGVFAAFANTGGAEQILLITAIFTLVLFPCIFIWMAGGLVLKLLLNNETHIRIFNVTTGLLLALSIILILI